MGFWDEVSLGLDRFGKGVAEFGDNTVRATKEFSQIQKHRSEIAQEERRINTQYLRLGRKFYEEHREDPELAEDPMFRIIADSKEKIADCEREIARLKASGAESRAASEEEAAAVRAAQDAAAEDAAGARARRADSSEVRQANEEDDIVDYQPVEPADESDFVEDDESDFAEE